MIDLTLLPQRYLDTLGREKVAEIIGASGPTIAMWISRGKFPLDAVQKLLAFDPTPLHEETPFYGKLEVGKKLIILMPMTHGPEPQVMDAFARLYDPREMDFKRFAFNNISVARNALLGHWLRGPWPWAIWWDADMVPPFGDAEAFKEICNLPSLPEVYAGLHSIYRMLVHQRPFVAACYVGRRQGAPPQMAEGDTLMMRSLIRRGPRTETMERDWTGFGFVLMHRKVPLDMIAQLGDEVRVTNPAMVQRFGYEHALFSQLDHNTPGDDISFSLRATRCGHKPLIDMSVFAAHIGPRAYTFADLV